MHFKANKSLRALSVVLCFAFLTAFFNFSTNAEESNSVDALMYGGLEGELNLEDLKTRVLPAEDRPSVVSAKTTEENGHVNRLREQEQNLYDIIFENRDGTKTLYSFSYPVKYISENGDILDKSNVIVAANNGDYAFENRDNDIKVYFPKVMGADSGMVLEKGKVRIEMWPSSVKTTGLTDISVITQEFGEGVLALNEALGEANTYAAEEATAVKSVYTTEEGISEDAVVFEGVFGKSTSTRYSAMFDGIKEDIILSKYTGINEFEFAVETNGLKLCQNDNGEYIFVEPYSGEEKARLGELMIYDSTALQLADEGADDTSYNHHYKVSEVKENQQYMVTIVVDQKFLTNTDTVYPVYIDPVITLDTYSSSEYGVYTNYIQDTYVEGPTQGEDDLDVEKNHNNSALLQVGAYNGHEARTLINFEWLTYDDSRNPLAGTEVTSAKIYLRDLFSGRQAQTITAYGVTKVWHETTATGSDVSFDSAVGSDAVVNAFDVPYGMFTSYNPAKKYGSRTLYYGNAWTEVGGTVRGVGFYDIDVTSYFQEVLKDYEHKREANGIMIISDNPDRQAHTFAGKEYSISKYRPALVVNYQSMGLASRGLSLSKGGTVEIKASTVYSDNHGLETSDSSVATVSWVGTSVSQGIKITGHSNGVATIKMYRESDPSKFVRCTVTVADQNLMKIYISPEVATKPYLSPNGNMYPLSRYNENTNMYNIGGYLKLYLNHYYVDVLLDTTDRSNGAGNYSGRPKYANDNFFLNTDASNSLYLALHTNAGGGDYVVSFYNSVNKETNLKLSDKLTAAIADILPDGERHSSIVGNYASGVHTYEGNLGELRENESWGYNRPVVLIEMGFHDNPKQVQFLINHDNEKYIAETLAKELIKFYNIQPKLQ